MTLTGSRGHVVRSPVVIRPIALATPAEVFSTGGPVSWDVKVGYTGTLSATVRGVEAANETPFVVEQDPNALFTPGDPTGTFTKDVVVPANSVFRAGIYEDAITPDGTDLDLFVLLGTTIVGASADGDSNEEVTLRTGATGVTLTVAVHGSRRTARRRAARSSIGLEVGDGGNTTLSGVGPASLGVGQTHTASFSGSRPACGTSGKSTTATDRRPWGGRC